MKNILFPNMVLLEIFEHFSDPYLVTWKFCYQTKTCILLIKIWNLEQVFVWKDLSFYSTAHIKGCMQLYLYYLQFLLRLLGDDRTYPVVQCFPVSSGLLTQVTSISSVDNRKFVDLHYKCHFGSNEHSSAYPTYPVLQFLTENSFSYMFSFWKLIHSQMPPDLRNL